MQLLKKLKHNKIFKWAVNIIKAFLVIFMIIFILVVYLQKFSNNKISFFNYRMFTVVSESMKPKYEIGDVLFSKKIDTTSIKVGDDISYLGRTGDVKDKIITHQVTGIDQNSDGELVFHTQGLNNLIEDPLVYEEQIYGVVVHKSGFLSFIYKIVATSLGLYFFIIIPLILIIGYEIVATLVEKEDKRRAKLGI